MFILDTLLINGIKFALEKVVEVAEQELAEIETDIFARIRDLKGSDARGGIADASAFEDIEVEIADDEKP